MCSSDLKRMCALFLPLPPLRLWLALVAAYASLPQYALADDDGFYKGKTVTMIVGYPPGGGYDAYGRLFAAHVARHIPGNPTVVVQNMPGASAITAANYVTGKAPRDGTVMVAFSASAAFAQTFGNAAALYKPTDFTWKIGRAHV